MKISVHHSCEDFESYRAARVKSLFNISDGSRFVLETSLPIEDGEWQIGLVAGPSGSGKSSIGRALWGERAVYRPRWPKDRPIVDAIAPHGDFNAVTGALASVGLGSVPSWLRPYRVLSMGERFRADLARVICDSPGRIVIDEFSSVVDRHPFFSEEIEWRLVSRYYESYKDRDIKFDERRTTLIPFVELPLDGIHGDGRLFEEVYVGPSPNPTLAFAAIASFLSNKGACSVTRNSLSPERIV